NLQPPQHTTLPYTTLFRSPGEYAYYRRKASEIHPVAAPASRRTMKDPYDVLGVPKSASAKEIKAAFRRLAKKYHPDQRPDDPRRSEEHTSELQSRENFVCR